MLVCTERVSGIWGHAGAVHVADCFRCSISFSFDQFTVKTRRQHVLVRLGQVHLGELTEATSKNVWRYQWNQPRYRWLTFESGICKGPMNSVLVFDAPRIRSELTVWHPENTDCSHSSFSVWADQTLQLFSVYITKPAKMKLRCFVCLLVSLELTR